VGGRRAVCGALRAVPLFFCRDGRVLFPCTPVCDVGLPLFVGVLVLAREHRPGRDHFAWHTYLPRIHPVRARTPHRIVQAPRCTCVSSEPVADVAAAVPFLPGPVSSPAVCGGSPTGLAFFPPTMGVTHVTAMVTPCVGEGQQQRTRRHSLGCPGHGFGRRSQTVRRPCSSTSGIFSRPWSSESSNRKENPTTVPPALRTRSTAALPVPPVASTSSMMSTRLPGVIASEWISTVAVPYSRS